MLSAHINSNELIKKFLCIQDIEHMKYDNKSKKSEVEKNGSL
jgi:hypothetical protein